MIRFISLSLIFTMTLGFSQDNEMVEIETNDGNFFLGEVIEESSLGYRLKTQDGIIISIPSEAIKKINSIETTTSYEGQVWRADPNKSMYLFAPSAYPIEKNKSYCRDFCLVFPSYNRGYGNNFSLQAGAFVFPDRFNTCFAHRMRHACNALMKFDAQRCVTNCFCCKRDFC